MSNIFAKYRKEFSGVKVVPSSKVWIMKNNKYVLNDKLDIIGKVDMSMANSVL